MKQLTKQIVLSALLLASVIIVSAQKAADILNSSVPMVYLGIDFTEARVINDFSATAYDIKNRHFQGINQVVVNESDKFNWQKYLERSNISSDITVTQAVNDKIDENKISSTNTADESRLKESDIQGIVNKYDLKGKTGVGLVVIMEALNKSGEVAVMYITFIDMASKKVLYTERMVEKAGGFGFRNYYASTIYKAMQTIKKNKLKGWRSKFGS